MTDSQALRAADHAHPDIGTCVISLVNDGEDVRVDQADPIVYVSQELYDATIRNPHRAASAGEGLVEVRGINRTIRYRLDPDGYCPRCDAWRAVLS